MSLREIAGPFVVAPSSGASTRDRLRPTGAEAVVLAELGEFLGGLYRADYATRAREGRIDTEARAESRRDRKRSLTAVSSSRWAGAITRKVEDQYALGMRGLYDHRMSLRQAVSTLEARLAVEPGERVKTTRGAWVRGYRDKREWFAKSRRAAVLGYRLGEVQTRIDDARPPLVHGGRRLWRNRNNLAQAGLTEAQWRQRCETSRWFFTADGETGKRYGNETIRVAPDGRVTIKIPTALVAKYGSHLTLTAPLNMNTYRAGEWLDRINDNRAVGYSITVDPARGRWYIQAAWSYPVVEQPSLTVLQGQPTLGVDLNDQFLTAWVIDPSGNPVGGHHTIPVATDGLPATTRDGHVRHAVTRLIRLAHQAGCASITIENLGFDRARSSGRETMGRGHRGKRFRRRVAGLPTGGFRQRLAGMTSEHAITVIAVDPAYTSRWAKQHWLPNVTHPAKTRKSSGPVTVHHAAAIVIGRRGKHQPARRNPAGLRTRQRTNPDPPVGSRRAPTARPRRVAPDRSPPHPNPTRATGREDHEHQSADPTPFGVKQDSLLPTTLER